MLLLSRTKGEFTVEKLFRLYYFIIIILLLLCGKLLPYHFVLEELLPHRVFSSRPWEFQRATRDAKPPEDILTASTITARRINACVSG